MKRNIPCEPKQRSCPFPTATTGPISTMGKQGRLSVSQASSSTRICVRLILDGLAMISIDHYALRARFFIVCYEDRYFFNALWEDEQGNNLGLIIMN